MTEDLGAAPRSGWARLVPELCVTDLEASVAFWCGLLGFQIAYRRPAERFVYLEQAGGEQAGGEQAGGEQAGGAQVMLCQRNGRYETGPLEKPLGQGAMFQIYVPGIAPMLAAVTARGWPLYEPVREVWYRVGGIETGHRHFFVQDPDGYLLMIAEDLGERPAAPAR
ncbi:MAG: VOC family protein [Alphaproteobacteria bacterium]|nr:VOC family protein [Alphaproteobacteria bacterium]